MALTKAAPRKRVAVREAGGDNEVERDGNGRPRILVACDNESCVQGKTPSLKVEGRMNKCQRCKGEGRRKVSYTRVTTFIDALEDKEALMTWEGRMVLIGVARDTGFLKGVLDGDPEDKEFKDILNRRAEAAKELAGADAKSKKGTLLHGYTELTDVGAELPDDIEPEDFLDIMSYDAATKPLFEIVLMEQLMVNDEYGTAGTPDRVSRVRKGVTLVAPDGTEIGPDELLITDLKTGRVDYGALKMAMQLALYSRSKRYDKLTGQRVEVPGINQKWGVIMHTPAGRGTTELYWADLTIGWWAVSVAHIVRYARKISRQALIPLELSAA